MHMLMHIPPHLALLFRDRQRGWPKACGATFKRGVFKSKAVVGQLALALGNPQAKQIYATSADTVLGYMIKGARAGTLATYGHQSACFDPFPFPADVPERLQDQIRAQAEALDALRKRVLAEHADLTLTGLYNVLEKLRAGTALTLRDRDVHDRGLVTLVRQHHDAIDALIAEAYGWSADLTDAEILTVALNRVRAAEEAKG